MAPNTIILKDLLFYPEFIHWLQTFHSYFTFGKIGKASPLKNSEGVLSAISLETGEAPQVLVIRERFGVTVGAL